MSNSNDRVSTEVSAFNNFIAVDINFESITWELFGTPEYTGGVPGPTDYVTLIAQGKVADDKKFDQRPATGLVWIAPESVRPWLDKEFQELFRNSKNSEIDVSKQNNCRIFNGKIKKTSKPVSGIICKNEKKFLIYLTIEDFTTAEEKL